MKKSRCSQSLLGRSSAQSAQHRRREFIWIWAPTAAPVLTIATTTTAPVTGTGNGIEENGTGIAGTADIIGLGAIRPLTDAKTAGLCKTVSASRIEGPPALRAARWRCLPTLQSQDSDREALGSHVRQHRAAVTSCSARCGRPGARSP